jgi:hypothetical protein
MHDACALMDASRSHLGVVVAAIASNISALAQIVRQDADQRQVYLVRKEKCVRMLTDITTDDEGVANVLFAFPTNLVGGVYAFDMFPEGGPGGDKYQSAQVSFQ